MNYLFQMKKSKNQKDCFHYAAKIANIDVLKKATEGDLNKRDEDGRTPTHWAAFKGNINALILIVSKGGNPKKCDHFGNTALHYAVRGGSLLCVTYLVNFCPEIVFILDNNYKIAQDVALIHHHKNIFDVLESAHNELMHSKDVNIKKIFQKSLKDVKLRREKFQKVAKDSIEKVLNNYDYTTSCTSKKIEEESLLANDEMARIRQSFIGRLIVAPK